MCRLLQKALQVQRAALAHWRSAPRCARGCASWRTSTSSSCIVRKDHSAAHRAARPRPLCRNGHSGRQHPVSNRHGSIVIERGKHTACKRNLRDRSTTLPKGLALSLLVWAVLLLTPFGLIHLISMLFSFISFNFYFRSWRFSVM